MWVRALRGTARLDKAEWSRLDFFSRWLIASRSQVLIMTFISGAIAGLLALRAGRFDPLLWVLTTLGLVLAHATNNILNDLTDYLRGVDRGNYVRAQYGPHPLEHGFTTPRGLFAYALVTGLLALAAGAYPVIARGPLALGLLAAGAVALLLYTWPLKYLGLGELTVFVVWGPLMIGGGYYVISGAWDWNAVIAGIPYALGTTAVLLAKHVDKLGADREKGVRTLPVLLGDEPARWLTVGMMALEYAVVAYLVAIGFFTPVMLVVAFALPTLVSTRKVFSAPHPRERPDLFPAEVWPLWFVAFAFVHNRRFGLLFLVGLVLEVGLRALGVF
jgi:1,4-dihydroxy-2-naphthoate octaprenyltransferase